MVRIYNGILLRHKKNEIMPSAATWMGHRSSYSEKDKKPHISLTRGV